MNEKKSTASSKIRWVGTLLSLALLVYLFGRHWNEIILVVKNMSAGLLLLCLLLTLVSRIAVGSRWHMLLQVTDQKINWGKAQRITFAGLFASNFLPTTIGGDVIRLAGAVQYRLDGAVAAASLIVDRLIGMFGMAIVLPLGIPPLVTWFSTPRAQAGYIPAFAVAGSFSKLWQRLTKILNRVWYALSLWRNQPQALLIAFLFTLLHQLCLYLTIALLLHDLGETIPFWQIPGIWSFIYFVTLLPISMNGYGVQELALTFFLIQVAGVSESAALAVAILLRTIQMLASLPGAAFVPAIMAGERQEQANV